MKKLLLLTILLFFLSFTYEQDLGTLEIQFFSEKQDENIVFRVVGKINSTSELRITKDLQCDTSTGLIKIFSPGITLDLGYGNLDSISLETSTIGKVDCSFRVQEMQRPYSSKEVFATFNEEGFTFPKIRILDIVFLDGYKLHYHLENNLGGISKVKATIIVEEVIDDITHDYTYEIDEEYDNSSIIDEYFIINQSLKNPTFTINFEAETANALKTSKYKFIEEVMKKNPDINDVKKKRIKI